MSGKPWIMYKWRVNVTRYKRCSGVCLSKIRYHHCLGNCRHRVHRIGTTIVIPILMKDKSRHQIQCIGTTCDSASISLALMTVCLVGRRPCEKLVKLVVLTPMRSLRRSREFSLQRIAIQHAVCGMRQASKSGPTYIATADCCQ